jgi:hypothetical protein
MSKLALDVVGNSPQARYAASLSKLCNSDHDHVRDGPRDALRYSVPVHVEVATGVAQRKPVGEIEPPNSNVSVESSGNRSTCAVGRCLPGAYSATTADEGVR